MEVTIGVLTENVTEMVNKSNEMRFETIKILSNYSYLVVQTRNNEPNNHEVIIPNSIQSLYLPADFTPCR
jgi:hypothetical protein